MSPAADVAVLVNVARQISVIVHRHPDGDSLGSAVALQKVLPNKKIRIHCQSPVPAVFQSILGRIEVFDQLTKTDLVIVVDCSEIHHTGFPNELAAVVKNGTPIIVIDHHHQGNLHKIARINWCDTKATATTALVKELIDEMRLKISPTIATALLLGLYTDTGGFQHPNTGSSVLKLAGRLIEQGGSLSQISENLSAKRTLIQTKLWGFALSAVTIDKKGLATTKISRQVMTDLGANDQDAAGLANLLCLLDEARASLVLVETDNGWRGTLRTRHKDMNMRELATIFNGKGSRKSAGFLATNELVLGKILDDN